MKVPFAEWDAAVDLCLKSFDPKKLYVHRCGYDSRLQCNHVDEVASEPLAVYDCKEEKKFCSNLCVQDHSSSMCYSHDGIEHRNYYYS